jgi:hypothetical protein
LLVAVATLDWRYDLFAEDHRRTVVPIIQTTLTSPSPADSSRIARRRRRQAMVMQSVGTV